MADAIPGKSIDNKAALRAVRKDRLNAHFDPLVGHPHRKLILAVMCLSLIVIVLDNSILNVAIPTMVQELGASDKELLWIIDAYTLMFAGLLLTAGSIGDKFGRRKTLQTGLLIFGSASIISAIANSSSQLIIGRGIMGIGGAAIMPATLSIITIVFPPKERAKAIGVWAAFAGVGGAIGPLTGGLLIEHFWWGSVFLVNVPIVIFAIVMNFILVPESKDASAPKLDIVGSILSIIALMSLLYAIIVGAVDGYSDPLIITSFIVAAITFAIFFTWESKTAHPMLKLQFFKDRRFSAGSLTLMLIFFAMFGTSVLLTQYMQLVLGYTPLQSGVAFIPFALTMFIAAPSSAKLAAMLGTKTIVCIGLTMVAVALFTMSFLTKDSTYPEIVWRFILMAAGMGVTMAPCTSTIMNSLPRAKAGVGSAMNDTTRMVGGALGIAIVGSAASHVYREYMSKSEDMKFLEDQFVKSDVDQSKIDQLHTDIMASVGKAIHRAYALINPDTIVNPDVKRQVEQIPETTRVGVGNTVINAAQDSFIHGLNMGMRVAAIAIVIAVIYAAIWMPQNSLSEDQQAGVA